MLRFSFGLPMCVVPSTGSAEVDSANKLPDVSELVMMELLVVVLLMLSAVLSLSLQDDASSCAHVDSQGEGNPLPPAMAEVSSSQPLCREISTTGARSSNPTKALLTVPA
mmetsp:Transcript_27223/g.51842  ORF Transcript_27223/g.51842 Transcript_27223/m.51842 type:complete len:110 (+) Transcript_27223:1309-1638(+)